MITALERPETDAPPFTPAQVTYALTRLGATAVGVARQLDVYGARGVRHECTLCPVARYLETQFGCEFSVNYQLATWHDHRTGRWQDVPLPAAVALFVTQFDHGHWARLADEVAE